MKDDDIDDDERDSSCSEENADAASDTFDDAGADNCEDTGKLSCFIHTCNSIAFMAFCPIYKILHQDLFDQLSCSDRFSFVDVSPKELHPLLLFGIQSFEYSCEQNHISVLEATICFMKASARFS